MIHDYEGDGFCVALVDGVPCLGERADRDRHIIDRAEYAYHRFTRARVYGVHQRYLVFALSDGNDSPILLEIHENRYLAIGNAMALKPDFDEVWVEHNKED